jgi:hypothetical protein
MGAARITGDASDRVSLLEGMAGCDWVVNLANIHSRWEPDKRIGLTEQSSFGCYRRPPLACRVRSA